MANDFSMLPRNFTTLPEERMRAMIAGLPAYLRRRRRIEDLQVAIVRRWRAYAEKAKGPVDPRAPPAALVRMVASLRELVEAHNRYYPIEANLPIDRVTGEPLDRGKPWAPLMLPTLETLLARAVDVP
jgi:hypothetical protein